MSDPRLLQAIDNLATALGKMGPEFSDATGGVVYYRRYDAVVRHHYDVALEPDLEIPRVQLRLAEGNVETEASTRHHRNDVVEIQVHRAADETIEGEPDVIRPLVETEADILATVLADRIRGLSYCQTFYIGCERTDHSDLDPIACSILMRFRLYLQHGVTMSEVN